MESKQGPSNSKPEGYGEVLSSKLEDANFVKQNIEGIDEDVIKDVLSTILRRAGCEEKINLFPHFKYKIKAVFDEKAKRYGYLDLKSGNVILNRARFIEEDISEVKTRVLETIIHETLHALSVGETEDDMGIFSHSYLGHRKVTRYHNLDDIQSVSWKLLNEGMTELIKDDVLSEYLNRTGDRKKFKLDSFKESWKSLNHQYEEGRYLINSLIGDISEETGVPPEVVRESLVKAYFSATDMSTIKEEIKEILGRDFYQLDINPDKDELTKDLNDFTEMDIIEEKRYEQDKTKPPYQYLRRALTNYLKRSLTR